MNKRRRALVIRGKTLHRPLSVSALRVGLIMDDGGRDGRVLDTAAAAGRKGGEGGRTNNFRFGNRKLLPHVLPG